MTGAVAEASTPVSTGVSTLRGPVAPDDLGIVAICEHLLYGTPGWHVAPEAAFDRAQAFEQALARMLRFKALGGRTLVDLCGISLGRNVPFYKRLSEVSGVQVVATTGFDGQRASIPTHFRLIGFFYRGDGPLKWKRAIPGHFAPSHSGSMEYLMFLFYNELTEGMAAPSMMRTPIKAGMVRTGADWDGLTQVEDLAARAAGLAARKAGVPVYIGGINQSRRQFDRVRSQGLPPERIVIGGCDDARALDPARDRGFAEQGAYVAYDHIGWEQGPGSHAISDERRAAMVRDMVAAGFADRVLLSCSAIGHPLGSPGSPHGFSHLLESFVPRLSKAGVGEDAVETMLVTNPARVLAPAQTFP